MKIDFIPDPSLYPFQPRWFDSNAGRLPYIDEGDGPPVLFCHSNSTWSFCTAPSSPGSAASSAASRSTTWDSGCPSARRG
jgi:hypothetical protein